MTHFDGNRPQQVNRRDFVRGSLAAASLPLVAPALGLGAEAGPAPAKPAEFARKIKLGAVGLGGRGSWIAGLFKEHGGFEMHAVADYFPEVADRKGEALGVDKSRRFSGLSGYKRLIEAGNTVIVIEHNLDVIKVADWVIDLGPDGGAAGGQIIAEGTPEDVARVKESRTGEKLRGLLGG